jgi:hypothetical protein
VNGPELEKRPSGSGEAFSRSFSVNESAAASAVADPPVSEDSDVERPDDADDLRGRDA